MSSDFYAHIAGEIADEGAAAESAFLAWLDEYVRGEAEPGRTPHDEMRAAFMAGRANLEEVKGLLGRELQSANAVIMRQVAGTVTEYAHQMSGGGFRVWNTEPYIEEIYPLAERVKNGLKHGGKVYRRRVIVVEDWEEVTEP